MQEIFFLLLPVAAFYGWYMGVRSVYQKKQKKGNQLSREYVQGLNFLLNEQPDKAVDHFIALLDVDDETIETHLALGNLFRQNGEVDRAIRIHQNLIARPSLTLEQRDLAMLQLGKDFYQSGLFDRSEETFIQLKESPEYRQVALENLLLIYQQLKDWQEAINCTEQMDKIGKAQAKPRTLSYLYCSLADQMKKPEQQKQAVKLYQKALVTFPKCIRACLAMADYYEQNQQLDKALQILEQVPELDIDFTEVILEKLHTLHKQANTEQELMLYLKRIIQLGAGASAVILLAKLIAEFQSIEKAQTFMLQELRRNPTMKGFNHLMTYHLSLAQSDNEKESLLFLHKLVSEQITFRPQYRCQKCGYSTKKLFWQCPSCKSWGRIKPIRGLDGE
ncbi:lipopolysaccharide assembly protein LapB [Psychromonas sp. 14N.309.X.WAT.B.A12]|uniref:lipopolysaccharide assembly protein LapB n=1 Tax=unclassified Psychromonas TaxID=2614957 RepID=UPI0025B0326E|nr:lipopolysaccharide assembly protein LapB [Psychromonas sp. 14N.309.X.WAT.B.A12]MDN2662876.1 lipopolysaccharide assembly protein LapB [Psychromonas sp. 14N.309.X.WAT.B.A12]